MIREATEADVPAILEIYNEAVLHTTATADEAPLTLDDRLEWFRERTRKGLPVLVFSEEGRVVGWAALSPYSHKTGYRFAVENSVYVTPECQGRGVGKKLLAELLRRGREGGFATVIASIDARNEASIRLHEQFGFREAARYRSLFFKFGEWLDVVHMQCMLTGPKNRC